MRSSTSFLTYLPFLQQQQKADHPSQSELILVPAVKPGL